MDSPYKPLSLFVAQPPSSQNRMKNFAPLESTSIGGRSNIKVGSDPMNWKGYFKQVLNIPSTLGSIKPKSDVSLPSQLHSFDNRYFQQAVKNQKNDGIPTVYLSPFNGNSASINPAKGQIKIPNNKSN